LKSILKKWRPTLSQKGEQPFSSALPRFGDYLVPEQVRKLGHDQQTPQGQQPAVMALTSIGPQEQRAQIRLTGHFIVHEQGRDVPLDAQVR
jgi:hypothetical protein